MARRSANKRKRDVTELNMMLSIALAFRYSTETLEKEVAAMDIAPSDLTRMGGPQSRTKHEVWVAYKAVSHFTLHQAFESFVKYILAVEGGPVPDIHILAKLYDRMSDLSKDRFQRIHEDTVVPVAQEVVSFVYSSTQPDTPKPAQVGTVRQQFDFMDKRMRLHQRRYQSDDVGKTQFTTYYLDMTPYFAMLDGISEYAHTLKVSWMRTKGCETGTSRRSSNSSGLLLRGRTK